MRAKDQLCQWLGQLRLVSLPRLHCVHGLRELPKAQRPSLQIWPTGMLIMEPASLWEELVRAGKAAHSSHLSNGCDREVCGRHLLPSPLFVEIFKTGERGRVKGENLFCVSKMQTLNKRKSGNALNKCKRQPSLLYSYSMTEIYFARHLVGIGK